MPKSSHLSTGELVAEYYFNIDHPMKEVVEALRKIILSADQEIAEQIKWNSPAFYYTGHMKPFDPKEYKRDIVVFNLHKKDTVLLVFPTGARISDTSGLLEGNFTDGRKVAKFVSPEEVSRRGEALKTLIRLWLAGVEK
ncbi:MAG: DUF1801 domain-containing protein [Lentimicrobium sp.]